MTRVNDDSQWDTGRFARAFIQLMDDVHALVPAAVYEEPFFARVIREHLGVDPAGLSVVEQLFAPSDHPNLQLAFEHYAAESERSALYGLPIEATHWSGFGLANLAAPRDGPSFDAVAPAFTNVPVDVDRTLACVTMGVWLLEHEGAPVVALIAQGDSHRGSLGMKVEVLCREREDAVAFLAGLSALAHRLNVYRGKVLSFTFTEWGSFGLEFHRLPALTRDDLILPEEDLAAIERHTVGVADHVDALRRAGRHLKRGLLLFGPPGTGKTFSVMYLCSRMPGRTTILLSGQAAPTLGQAAAIARSLAPSMLVLEDVDLVAMERTLPGMGSNPLLFQLLNEMDGLDEDADVIFVLTTNRVDLLEPALAARPGRIDQAVEIQLPDATCRRRLLDRYFRGMITALDDVDGVVERTAGVSAAFLKELARRAALTAAEDSPDREEIVVRQADVDAALDDLLDHATPTLRASLGADPELAAGFSAPPAAAGGPAVVFAGTTSFSRVVRSRRPSPPPPQT